MVIEDKQSIFNHYRLAIPQTYILLEGRVTDGDIKRLDRNKLGLEKVAFLAVTFFDRDTQENQILSILNACPNLRALSFVNTYLSAAFTTLEKIRSLESFEFTRSGLRFSSVGTLFPFIKLQVHLTHLTYSKVPLELDLLDSISGSIQSLSFEDCYIGHERVFKKILSLHKLEALNLRGCRFSSDLSIDVFEKKLFDLPYFRELSLD